MVPGCPFILCELQSRWVASILSGRISLPSEEKMMEDVKAFYSKLDAAGVPKLYTHNIGDHQVEHFFRHRINSSVMHASDYLKQFPSPIISIVAKFMVFISGGFAAVLIIIALWDESLLEGHIFGRNLFWYAAVFGAVTAVCRAAVTNELLVLDPEGSMSLVVQHTHYMPKRWRGKENTESVRMEFETLFQYTTMMWLEEMASIFLTPYLLIFVVPKRVDDILQFITEFTVYVDGVGDVCRTYKIVRGNGLYAIDEERAYTIEKAEKLVA